MAIKVISLQKAREEKAPHLSGQARCLSCGKEWVAVAPIGAEWLECPACSLMKGRFVYHNQRDAPHWTCGCGNDLFSLTPSGVYCPNCGEWQEGY